MRRLGRGIQLDAASGRECAALEFPEVGLGQIAHAAEHVGAADTDVVEGLAGGAADVEEVVLLAKPGG